MRVKELDVVKLKDGSTGTIMHIHAGGTAAIIEFDSGEGSDLRTIELTKIESVVEPYPSPE